MTDHKFKVQIWDTQENRPVETVAEAGHFSIADAAYNAALDIHYNKALVMRQGARMIKTSFE
ncbi:hypothetical protein [Pseudovibrio ascidiaceicola]|uniref:hypothetical protein n=1 Tax=Pseudovibrio ascidiaceicola TaxID=285279 RepID=UPI000D68594D|nr:hypothetical protein [Pseudovibrio ascidiaceicola]